MAKSKSVRRRKGKISAVNIPVATAVKQKPKAAVMRTLPDGGIRVKHRELLGTVSGSVLFEWDQYMLNPGLNEVFPWLSGIARRYEAYRMHNLKFSFVPRVSSATAGAVTLAFDHDPSDVGPETLVQAMTYQGCVRDSVIRPLTGQAPKAENLPWLYVRSSAQFESLSDVGLRSSDLGSLFVATDGFAGTTEVGELWVDYDFTFRTPQLEGVVSGSLVTDTPIGTMDGGILKGVTRDAQYCAANYGAPITISDGVVRFLDSWRGFITAGAKSASAPGGISVKGTSPNPVLPPMQWTTPLLNGQGSTNTTAVNESGYAFSQGSTFKPYTGNAVSGSAASTLIFTPVAPRLLDTLSTTLGGGWMNMTPI